MGVAIFKELTIFDYLARPMRPGGGGYSRKFSSFILLLFLSNNVINFYRTMHDARRTMRDDGKRPVAIGHPSASGDLKYIQIMNYIFTHPVT